jgi:hypothetical protein
VLAALVLAPRAATAEPERSGSPAAKLQGILRGAILRMEPYFRFEPDERATRGVMGKLKGTSREFEEIVLEFGADRSVLTAATRAAYEAYRIKHVVERGEQQTAEVKPDGSVVRLTNPFKDAVYACATKQVGRTAVFVRGDALKKQEAGLVRLVKALVSGVTSDADEIDGWIPPEVKATWTRTPSADLVVVDDGAVAEPAKQAIVKAVRDAYAVVRRSVSGSAPFPPVVRITKSRDMIAHLSGRRDLSKADAVYVPSAAELLVSPRDPAALDLAQIAGEAAAQEVHYLLGAYDAEPLLTGLRRQAMAAVSGEPLGSLLHSDEERALERVKAHQSTSWARLMKMSTLTGFLSEDADVRSIDAELAVVYASSAPIGRASLAGYVTAFKKWGHPDAGSEGAFGAMDETKSDVEYWAFWKDRTEPKKPTKPGKPGGK